MKQTQRIGVSLDSKLLSKFDKLIAGQGYTGRSEAIRDLLRQRLAAEQLTDPKTQAVAAVFVVYDHHHPQLAQKIIHLQHSQLLKTISSMHLHLDHHNCLEVILLRGRLGDITKLSDNIVSMKGVKSGRVNLITTTE
jgi:CopG family nickel-responsive transcriptional regulator